MANNGRLKFSDLSQRQRSTYHRVYRIAQISAGLTCIGLPLLASVVAAQIGTEAIGAEGRAALVVLAQLVLIYFLPSRVGHYAGMCAASAQKM